MVGTIVGGAIAALVFAISAVSVPLLTVRRIDAVTAMQTSLAAVRLNPQAMALWAGLIAGFMALGLATVFVGLAIAFPCRARDLARLSRPRARGAWLSMT